MIRFVSSYVLLLSCLTHLLCCGIPFFLSLTSLASNLSFLSISLVNLEWFERIEIFLYIFSTIILFILIISEFVFNKSDHFMDQNDCDTHSIKKISLKKIIYVSSILYFFNSIVFFSEVLII